MRCTISWSLLAIVYWSRDEGEIGWSKFLLEFALKCPHIYYVAPLLKGSLHLIKRYSHRERAWYGKIDDTGAR